MTDRNARSGMHDEAGVGPDPRNAVDLTPLKKLGDYKVADGEPDIRGWRTYTSTGREIGKVEDLLVDTKTNEVVMLDVDLEREDRHTLAPIKSAWIDRDNKRVVINSQYLVNDEDIPALRKHRRALRKDDSAVAATGAAAAESDEKAREQAKQQAKEDDEAIRRFNERYERAYGERGWDRGRPIRIKGDSELRLERPVLPPPDETNALPTGGEREVRFPRTRELQAGTPVVIEEHIVRRRLVDPSELDPDELERLRRDGSARDATVREGVERLPPGEERR